MFFEELAELAGQRNAIDGRIAQIAAEIDDAGLWGFTGVRSMEGLIAWKLGTSFRNAETIVAVARRLEVACSAFFGLRISRELSREL